jgi:hypothetical protein
MSFIDSMARARDRVKSLDSVDEFEDRSIQTIASALECGLKRPETEAQYDALWMLKDLIAKTKNGVVQ